MAVGRQTKESKMKTPLESIFSLEPATTSLSG
jgi:hypothetical protein